MKMWIGNLDGTRAGLVIAPNKTRARAIINTSRNQFEDYWVLQPAVDTTLEVETLYTRSYDARHDTVTAWYKGRCPTK